MVGGGEIKEDFLEEEVFELVLKAWRGLVELIELCCRRGSMCSRGVMSSLGWLEYGEEGWCFENCGWRGDL